MRSSLPIDSLATDLQSLITTGGTGARRILLDAPTGSGKSTRVAQFLADIDTLDGQILVLQPRRLAVRMLAERVAWERGCQLGKEVGYHVRLDRKESPETKILFMTEGIFLRRVLGDPELKGTAAVVLDEFHERHLETDLGLALGLHLQRTTRPDMALVVMSATLPGALLEEHLAPCQRLGSKGRTFPVEVAYRRPRAGTGMPRGAPEPIWVTAARACEELYVNPGSDGTGDTLVFMPGGFEIQRTLAEITQRSWARRVDLLPLHGGLSSREQDRAVAENSGRRRRRIIVTTNIAETSLTIPGVTAVVDSGLVRLASYDRGRGINTLHVRKISQASAEQRAGRAGRVAPGICLRLWDEKDHAARARHETPEIHRIDLSQSLLLLLASGLEKVQELPWLEAPHPDALERAHRLLLDLGALHCPGPGNPEASASAQDPLVTEIGHQMARFPAHPRIARMLKEAEGIGCLEAAAVCAAIISERDLFGRGKQVTAKVDSHTERDDPSDFLPRIRALARAEAQHFDLQACDAEGIHAAAARTIWQTACSHIRVAGGLGWTPGQDWRRFRDGRMLGRIVLAGFSDHVAARPSPGSNLCHLSDGRRGRLARESVLPSSERLLVAAEIIEIEGRDLEVTMALATAIDESLLEEVFPGSTVEKESTRYDPVSRRVLGVRERIFRNTILRSSETGNPDPEAAAALLAEEVLEERLTIKAWDTRAEEWISRINFLAEAMPELELEPIAEEERRLLLTQVCHGSTSQKNLKNNDPWPALDGWLAAPQLAALDAFAPERVKLPGGKHAKVTYQGEGGPRLSATIQDLYDLKSNPVIAGGNVALLVELLAPNRRPVQTTSEIGAFWKTSYSSIRRQLKGRYPKHEWR